jgi:broad specificity phosphatase PhoE
MSRSGWTWLLGGVVAGALVAAAIESLQKSRLADIEAQLSVVDQRLRELAPVKMEVDAYHAQKARFEAQVGAIQEEWGRQRCPGLLLLDLEQQAKAEVEAVALEGATLAVVGRAESDADAAAFAAGVRDARWARAVHEGRARQGGVTGASRFAVLATVEQPRCRAPETPEPLPGTER